MAESVAQQVQAIPGVSTPPPKPVDPLAAFLAARFTLTPRRP